MHWNPKIVLGTKQGRVRSGAQKSLLQSVFSVFRSLLLDHCCSSDVGVTLLMPGLARSDLKVVLDYVYRGWMTLRATQMASVIGVMEVLHLKCGVSVSKRQHSDCDWEPDRSVLLAQPFFFLFL